MPLRKPIGGLRIHTYIQIYKHTYIHRYLHAYIHTKKHTYKQVDFGHIKKYSIPNSSIPTVCNTRPGWAGMTNPSISFQDECLLLEFSDVENRLLQMLFSQEGEMQFVIEKKMHIFSVVHLSTTSFVGWKLNVTSCNVHV